MIKVEKCCRFLFLKKCFDVIAQNINEAVIVVDKYGKLVIANGKSQELLSINIKKGMGKCIEEVVKGIGLNVTLKKGESEFNKSFFANGREFIISKIVVTDDRKIQGAIAILQDITYDKKIQHKLIDSEGYINILDTVMNTVNECVVLVDKNGIITMMSKAYKEFLGCTDPEGKDVRDIIENTKLHEVIKDGNMRIGDIQEINGNKMIAIRLPIKENDEIVGAVGKVMFKDISDFYTLSKKLNNLEREIEVYKSELGKERKAKYSINSIIGTSPEIRKVKSLALKVAKTDSNVLITGESGTGKELFAHAIHNASRRYLSPFVEINCAAIPSELFESELFGYEEGAFTGAKKEGKKGKFELANGGTIFLDEIGDMPLYMQVKLLKVVQDKAIERVGSNILKKVDVRIVAATNRNIENDVKEGKFREDLYYRLNVMKINLPPLRERRGDIPIISNNLRIKIASKLGVYVEGISKEVMECLIRYNWPGNVRELENVIERAIGLLDSDLTIKLKHIPDRLVKNKKNSYLNFDSNSKLKDIVANVEKNIILDCLNKNNWNKNKVANMLGISRTGLYKKIDEYNLKI